MVAPRPDGAASRIERSPQAAETRRDQHEWIVRKRVAGASETSANRERIMISGEEARAAAEAGTADKAPAQKKTTAPPTAAPEPTLMAGSPGEPRGQRPEEFNPDDFE